MHLSAPPSLIGATVAISVHGDRPGRPPPEMIWFGLPTFANMKGTLEKDLHPVKAKSS
jgi:hypothetical protein